MGRNVFMSFLGTSKYIKATYYYKDNKVENVNYIQEALVKIFCEDFKDNDVLYIFMTENAEKSNWLGTENIPGLYNKLKTLNLPCKISPVKIPDGINEENLWKIFEIIHSNIAFEDNIILDITHGFRFLPMLTVTLLNYERFLNKITVKGIYYGALEVLGSVSTIEKELPEKLREVPIINLTSFDYLLQWSSAADNFVTYGNTKKLSSLIQENITPLLAQSSGKDKRASTLRSLIKSLNYIYSQITTVRGKAIYEGTAFSNLKASLSNLKNTNTIIPTLNPILKVIESKIDSFNKENHLSNCFSAVEWCIKHGLIQQGITLLQETIITRILESLELQWNNRENREMIGTCINIKTGNINISALPENLKEKKDLVNKVLANEVFNKLYKAYESLREYRNDINHGGFVENIKPESFTTKLEKIFKKVKNAIFEV
jgi:CRISPR-associated Csx2 family protein